MNGFRYEFEWDPAKEKENARKHRVSFERAATVFHDPEACSIFDKEHSESEDRWLTLGLDNRGVVPVVCHTFREIDEHTASIRIISSRKATRTETKQYKRKP